MRSRFAHTLAAIATAMALATTAFGFGGTSSWGTTVPPFTGGPATRPIALTVGTCAAPSLTFTGATSSGFYLIDSTGPRVGFCLASVPVMRIDPSPEGVSTNGQGNLVLGTNSGIVLNSAIGTTGGINNTIIGNESGEKLTTGNQNTLVGSRSGHETVTGTQNTFIGQGAGFSMDSTLGVMVGFHAGLDANATGATCVGAQACESPVTSMTGTGNTAVGGNALRAATTAATDTAVGFRAMESQSIGLRATAVGYQAGNALNDNDLTAVGYAACISCTGVGNTTIGSGSGFTGTPITTGSNNTLVGLDSQVNAAGAVNRNVFGKGAVGSADNEVVLGNTSVTLVQSGNGHILHYNAPTSYTSGSCTGETGTGTEAWGTITATCNNQTAIVLFTTTYASTPTCLVVPMNALASTNQATMTYTVSTTGITITQTANIAGEQWAFQCSE